MKRLMVFIALMVPVIGQSSDAESFKIETADYFNQITFGEGARHTFSTTITLPGLKWKSPLTLNVVDRVPTDTVDFSAKMQHLVPIDPGDPVPGPEFQYFHHFQSAVGINGSPLQIYAAFARHGTGADITVAVSMCRMDPVDIHFMYNFMIGFHGRAGDTIESWLAKLEETFPDAVKGGTHAKINRDGKVTIIQSAVEGIRSDEITGSGIHTGTPSNPGPRILETGGAASWQNAEGLGAVLSIPAFDLPLAVAATIHDQPCFFQVDFGPLGSRKLRGVLNLIPELERVAPNHFDVTAGLLGGGNLASLASMDGNYLSIINDENDSVAALEALANIPGDTFPEQAAVRVVSRASRTDLAQVLTIHNVLGGPNVRVNLGLSSLAPRIAEVSAIGLNGDYITPGAGTFRCTVEWIPIVDVDAFDGWSELMDQIAFGAWNHP